MEKIYLVGGAVRDELLGLNVVERDFVVVNGSEKSMLDKGYIQVGKDFPVFLHPQTKEEYALARTERKTGKGYKGFSFDVNSVSLEDDLKRRDLTINAIAKDNQGNIIDPYNGQEDIKNKILRHVSSSFSEDPLRVLRVARFAARFHGLGFSIADETISLMQQIVTNNEIENLTPERVWKEMSKALLEKNPEIFFETLRKVGALKIMFPALDILWGVPQKKEYHPEIDTGIHVMMVLKQAVKFSDSLGVRFAALCHDLGKGLTPKEEWPAHRGHEHAGIKPIKEFCDKYKVPNEIRDLAVIVSKHHLNCHRVEELRSNTILKIFQEVDAFRKPLRFKDFLLACKSDATGRLGSEDTEYPQEAIFLDALNAALNVDVKSIVKEGYTKEKLIEKISKSRIAAIEKIRGS